MREIRDNNAIIDDLEYEPMLVEPVHSYTDRNEDQVLLEDHALLDNVRILSGRVS